MVGKTRHKSAICTHGERAAIDLAIVRGISPNAIVKRYRARFADPEAGECRVDIARDRVAGSAWVSSTRSA